MNPLFRTAVLAVLASTAIIIPASAATIIDWITVGNAGNAADPLTGYGAVATAYQIGEYEVTNAQYAGFLNAVAQTDSHNLYNPDMASHGITRNSGSGGFNYSVTSDFENKPVVYVSWFDGARFSNWLNNGQGNASTETGSYPLNGATSGVITVNPAATIRLPSENQWYKAAYYNGASASYSLYPTNSNAITTADANYDSSIGHTTDVDHYAGHASAYGTLDQGGNVWEWNDADLGNGWRGVIGGAWNNSAGVLFSGHGSNFAFPDNEANDIGFRVVRNNLVAVPEPGSVLTMLGLIGCGLLLRRRTAL